MAPKTGLAAFLALALLVAPAWAEETDDDDLFHQAYVMEVVKGEVAEAAQRYLGLARDESVRPRIRAESRFRFAVCAVLLGRADEARVWLGGLIQDETVSDAHRERAKTYLESLSSVHVGSELEKRLDDMAFELGRAHPAAQVPVYRDLEILGDLAIPFLQQLLVHDDQVLRQHAYRVLARLGVEGLGAAWSPAIPFAGLAFNREVGLYFARRPEELATLEQKLLALDDETLDRTLSAFRPSHPAVSLEFLGALAARDGVKGWTFHYLPWPGEDAAAWDAVQGWLASEDAELSHKAADWLALAKAAPPPPVAAAVFPLVLRRLMEAEGPIANAQALIEAQDSAALLQGLDTVVAGAEAWEGVPKGSPLHQDYAGRLLAAIRAKAPEALDLPALARLYERLLLADLALRKAEAHVQGNRMPGVGAQIANVFTHLLEHLPEAEAVRLATWLFGHPELGTQPEVDAFTGRVPLDEPRHATVFARALQSATLDARTRMTEGLYVLVHQALPLGLRLALLRLMPELVEALEPQSVAKIVGRLPYLTVGLEDEDKVAAMRGVLLALGKGDDAWRRRALEAFFQRQAGVERVEMPIFVGTVLVPAAEAVWDQLSVRAQRALVLKVAHLLTEVTKHVVLLPRGREAVGAFLASRLDLLPDGEWEPIARSPDLFPLETWIPRAPRQALKYLKDLDPQTRDAAARALMAQDESVTGKTLEFVRDLTSEALAREVFDGLLASDAPAHRALAIDLVHYRSGEPASLDALEQALKRLLAADAPDLRRVQGLSKILVKRKPTVMLFDAAARLLESGERVSVMDGIRLAHELGRARLITHLVPHLSSLDSEVRSAAKGAIDAIQEVTRIQREAEAAIPDGE